MPEKAKTVLFIMSLIGWVAFIILLSVTNLSCISAPDIADYKNIECYDAAYCRYLNAKSESAINDCDKQSDYCSKIRVNERCKKENNSNACWHRLR